MKTLIFSLLCPLFFAQQSNVAFYVRGSQIATYNQIASKSLEPMPNFDVFSRALLGFENLKREHYLYPNCHLLAVADLSLSSNTKRFWVFDLDQRKLLYWTYVSHGAGSGEEFAFCFSNEEGSHQSSLGFYVTDVPYLGIHGLSLRLIGLDKGFNNNAFWRDIVLHGAGYVSEKFIQENQRLGRSWGCPALPLQQVEPIVDLLQRKACLFLYYPDANYLQNSYWLRPLPPQR